MFPDSTNLNELEELLDFQELDVAFSGTKITLNKKEAKYFATSATFKVNLKNYFAGKMYIPSITNC